jgi:hypothetical protein
MQFWDEKFLIVGFSADPHTEQQVDTVIEEYLLVPGTSEFEYSIMWICRKSHNQERTGGGIRDAASGGGPDVEHRYPRRKGAQII